MGAADSIEKALMIYDAMHKRAVDHALTYFSYENVLTTDVQDEANQLPTEYALIKQFNTVLDPSTVSGNQRRQHSTLIVEYNVTNAQQRQGLILQTQFTHHMSAESLSHLGVAIASITTNDYNNTHGAKFVTVIDFNYLVRV